MKEKHQSLVCGVRTFSIDIARIQQEFAEMSVRSQEEETTK